MTRKLSEKTYEICKMIAEGHRNKLICDLIGCKPWTVSECKKRYPDIIAEFQGKKMDGSPMRFEPGHGTESIAHIEPTEPAKSEVENPEPITEETNINSMKRHTIVELFQQIDELKAENATLKAEKDKALDTAGKELCARIELERQLAEAKGRTELDKGMLLRILTDEIDASSEVGDYGFIRGMAYVIERIVKTEEEK